MSRYYNYHQLSEDNACSHILYTRVLCKYFKLKTRRSGAPATEIWFLFREWTTGYNGFAQISSERRIICTQFYESFEHIFTNSIYMLFLVICNGIYANNIIFKFLRFCTIIVQTKIHWQQLLLKDNIKLITAIW